MTLLTPPQTPARFGVARFGGTRFGYVFALACAAWDAVAIAARTWTAISPCEND